MNKYRKLPINRLKESSVTSVSHFHSNFYSVHFLLFEMTVLTLQLIFLALSATSQSRPNPGAGQIIARSAATSSGLITTTNETTVLASASAPRIVTLDYGHAVEGIPSFEVVSVDGDASAFEVTYAESLAALSSYMVREAKIQVLAPFD